MRGSTKGAPSMIIISQDPYRSSPVFSTSFPKLPSAIKAELHTMDGGSGGLELR